MIGRFAPTPSGRMHLGNALSALLAWLGAVSAGGHMVMRIEDLDVRAQKPGAAQQLMDDMAWLGLTWEGAPVYQSQRQADYIQAVARLHAKGLLYPCFCTRAELHVAEAPHSSDGTYVYAGTCRNLPPSKVAAKMRVRTPSMRVKVPDLDDPAGIICIDDLVAGQFVQVLAEDVGDMVVRRSDGVFAYQLAVVVDDASMGVTQVVRGRDLLASAPRQRYLQRVLGLPEVEYAHVPLLVAPDGRRLSKRDHDLDLGALRDRGIQAEQIVGLLGWLVGLTDTPEAATPSDLLSEFSWQKVAAVEPEITIDGAILDLLL